MDEMDEEAKDLDTLRDIDSKMFVAIEQLFNPPDDVYRFGIVGLWSLITFYDIPHTLYPSYFEGANNARNEED